MVSPLSHRAGPRAIFRSLAPFLGALLGSCGLGQEILLPPAAPPVIAYASPLTFSVGVAATQAVNSTGGPVTGYAIAPPLPEGLALDAGTGSIAGVALVASAEAEYAVTATGPGGADTAVFLLRAVAVPVDPNVPRPEIAYLTPVTDTAGKEASHPVISSGGPVTGFSLLTALPPGLTLNAFTGLIAGTPTQPSSVVDFTIYSVIAHGPGGRDTAGIMITVAANPNVAAPQIAYASPLTDTVGKAAAHAVISTGGPVTSYSQYSSSDALDVLSKPQLTKDIPDSYYLPSGLTLNTATGLISGTPTQVKAAATYTIVATGPGGSDTATIRITVVSIGDPVPNPITSGLELSVTLNPPADSFSPVIMLEKAAVMPLSRMIVTLWSNLNDTIRDTINAGTQGFNSNRTVSQTVVKRYAAGPLRWWNATVQVSDANGAVIYFGSGGPTSSPAGQISPISMTLSPRYTPYRAALVLSDSLRSVQGGAIAKVNINRIVLIVDGDTVRDTTAPGGTYFPPTPQTFFLEYDYLNPGFLHSMAIYVYGNVSTLQAGSYLLYGATFNYTATGGTHYPTLNWMGPNLVQSVPVPSPLAYWDFNEGSGTTLTDRTGGGRNATISGATWVAGIEGFALRFDGVDDYASSPTIIPDMTQQTMMAWVYLESIKEGYLIGEGDIASGHDNLLSVHANGRFRYRTRDPDPWDQHNSRSLLQTGRWYHLTGVCTGDSVKVYLDGLIDTVYTGHTYNLTGYHSAIQFGRFFAGGQNRDYLHGRLDEVKIFNVALTSQQIQAEWLRHTVLIEPLPGPNPLPKPSGR